MAMDLSSFSIAFGGTTLLATLIYSVWHRIRIEVERHACPGVKLTDVVISISARTRRGKPLKIKCRIYIVLKSTEADSGADPA
jgi:hypothetical protein